RAHRLAVGLHRCLVRVAEIAEIPAAELLPAEARLGDLERLQPQDRARSRRHHEEAEDEGGPELGPVGPQDRAQAIHAAASPGEAPRLAGALWSRASPG